MDWTIMLRSRDDRVGDVLLPGWKITSIDGDWVHLERVAVQQQPETPLPPVAAMPTARPAEKAAA
jgi:hypothetical protein